MKKSEKFRHDVYYEIENVDIPIETNGDVVPVAKGIYDQCHDNAEPSFIGQFEPDKFGKAAIYLACQELGLPVAMEELGEADELGSYTRRIRKYGKVTTLPTPPQEFVDRYVDELNLTEEIRNIATDLVSEHVSSRRSNTIAAGAIYGASKRIGMVLTQKQIRQVSGVSEVSIRNSYKDMNDEGLVFA